MVPMTDSRMSPSKMTVAAQQAVHVRASTKMRLKTWVLRSKDLATWTMARPLKQRPTRLRHNMISSVRMNVSIGKITVDTKS